MALFSIFLFCSRQDLRLGWIILYLNLSIKIAFTIQEIYEKNLWKTFSKRMATSVATLKIHKNVVLFSHLILQVQRFLICFSYLLNNVIVLCSSSRMNGGVIFSGWRQTGCYYSWRILWRFFIDLHMNRRKKCI